MKLVVMVLFHFQKYQVEVTGIDLSTNMVAIAYERLDKIKNDNVSTFDLYLK